MFGARRLRSQKKKCVVYATAAGLVLCVYMKLLTVNLDVTSLLSSATCPACYSQNLCHNFAAGEFELVGWDKYYPVKFINQRNVYQAVWKPLSQAVVLKKLGSDAEISELDRGLCSYFHREERCEVGDIIENLENLALQHKSDLRGLDAGELSTVTLDIKKIKTIPIFQDIDFLECVNDQDLFDYILHRGIHHKSKPHLHNLLTILLINPEPLVAMSFQQSSGWPFPDYYGACGRLAVFQYIGQSLDNYYGHPWLLRAHFALELLKIAQKFSDNKDGLALYPTDWSANNFAVDWSTKKLYLVDLENIILVNQTRVRTIKGPGWNIHHEADRYGCKNCFSFHAQDLCTHVYTDHNYHGVCGGLLSKTPYSPNIPQGLLHAPPSAVVTRHPDLEGLIEDCATSSRLGGRAQTAQLIMEILQAELHDVNLDIFNN